MENNSDCVQSVNIVSKAIEAGLGLVFVNCVYDLWIRLLKYVLPSLKQTCRGFGESADSGTTWCFRAQIAIQDSVLALN